MSLIENSNSSEESCTINKDKNTAENADYYLNNAGLMVFTASYHLKRGYCCKNNCKHCPYGFNPEDVKE